MRGLARLLVAGLPIVAPAPAPARQAPIHDGLALEDVVRRALRAHPDVEIGRLEVDAAEGRWIEAGAPFDAVLATALNAARDRQPMLAADSTVAGARESESAGFELRGSKRLRSGVFLQPTVAVARSQVVPLSPVATTTASVGLDLVLPLLKDRGARSTEAAERAAAVSYSADELGLRHIVAVAVLEAVSAYWSYVAAQQRLEVQVSSQARAQRLADETRILVQAEERPASDLNQALANLATRRVARTAAAQALIEARRRVGLAMGLEPGQIAALPPPISAFPDRTPYAPDSARVAELIRAALSRRADLAALRARRSAARVFSDAADDALRPALDLSVGVGYTGMVVDAGLDGFFAPLYRNVPGVSASVGLEYRFPVANAAARGAALQRDAVYAQARVREAELRRQIASGIRVAVDRVHHASIALEQASRAVVLFRATVDAERQKRRLGMATLFDVILAGDGLTNALLAEVARRLDFAVALAGLRYEAGALVDIVDGRAVVAVQRLLMPL